MHKENIAIPHSINTSMWVATVEIVLRSFASYGALMQHSQSKKVLFTVLSSV